MNGESKLVINLRQQLAVAKLGRRELQVFILSGRSKTLKEISIILGISDRTVATYRANIFRKMDFENVYQVMEYCIRAEMESEAFVQKHIK